MKMQPEYFYHLEQDPFGAQYFTHKVSWYLPNNTILRTGYQCKQNTWHNLYDVSITEYRADGTLFSISYYICGEEYRKHGPSTVNHYTTGNVASVTYRQHSKLHNEYGPAIIYRTPNGKIQSQYYYINGQPKSWKRHPTIHATRILSLFSQHNIRVTIQRSLRRVFEQSRISIGFKNAYDLRSSVCRMV